eukprot:TRINITY_DN2266_c0_g2_i1.p1 TRINITY_DN2266_c0_g2~~TRINITY_DN2266_c0_g2_i1.p1  ORF type:complete len:441 (-),score=96.53 TRINITY_DN2266_c0_g2_i1:87-1355(-)
MDAILDLKSSIKQEVAALLSSSITIAAEQASRCSSALSNRSPSVASNDIPSHPEPSPPKPEQPKPAQGKGRGLRAPRSHDLPSPTAMSDHGSPKADRKSHKFSYRSNKTDVPSPSHAAQQQVTDQDGVPAVAGGEAPTDETEAEVALKAKQRMMEIRREEAQRKKQQKIMEQQRAEKVRQELAEKERARQQLEDEILRVRQQQMEERKKVLQLKEEEKRRQEELAKEEARKYALRLQVEVPLYEKMAKEFEAKVLMPELEKRKAALAALRNERRPINVDEIKQHEKHVLAKKEQILKQMQENRELKQAPLQLPNYYRGSAAEKIREEEERRAELARKKEEELRELLQKQKKYAEVVRQMHVKQSIKAVRLPHHLEPLSAPVVSEPDPNAPVGEAQRRNSWHGPDSVAVAASSEVHNPYNLLT